jgi:hypothetical protein
VFDSLKNLGSLPGLMAKAREMQDRMKSMQEELASKTATADALRRIVVADRLDPGADHLRRGHLGPALADQGRQLPRQRADFRAGVVAGVRLLQRQLQHAEESAHLVDPFGDRPRDLVDRTPGARFGGDAGRHFPHDADPAGRENPIPVHDCARLPVGESPGMNPRI